MAVPRTRRQALESFSRMPGHLDPPRPPGRPPRSSPRNAASISPRCSTPRLVVIAIAPRHRRHAPVPGDHLLRSIDDWRRPRPARGQGLGRSGAATAPRPAHQASRRCRAAGRRRPAPGGARGSGASRNACSRRSPPRRRETVVRLLDEMLASDVQPFERTSETVDGRARSHSMFRHSSIRTPCRRSSGGCSSCAFSSSPSTASTPRSSDSSRRRSGRSGASPCRVSARSSPPASFGLMVGRVRRRSAGRSSRPQGDADRRRCWSSGSPASRRVTQRRPRDPDLAPLPHRRRPRRRDAHQHHAGFRVLSRHRAARRSSR